MEGFDRSILAKTFTYFFMISFRFPLYIDVRAAYHKVDGYKPVCRVGVCSCCNAQSEVFMSSGEAAEIIWMVVGAIIVLGLVGLGIQVLFFGWFTNYLMPAFFKTFFSLFDKK